MERILTIALMLIGMIANAQCAVRVGIDTISFDCDRIVRFDTNRIDTRNLRLSKLIIANPTNDDLIGVYNNQYFKLKAGKIQVFVGDELTQIPDCEIYTQSGRVVVLAEKVLIPKSRFYGSFGANSKRRDYFLQGRY